MERNGHGLIDVLHRHLPGGTEEINGKPPPGWPVPAGIRTGILPDKYLEHYSYTKLSSIGW
jgi:hypothetical protein